MAYSRFHADWKNFPDTTTPITEAALEHIEDGIVDVDARTLDEIAAPAADVSLNSHKITGLASPATTTDAANKAYVDAVATGLDPKMSVRAATTANITLSGAQTIDGVSVIATNRVLVKNQTDAGDNGIYVAAAGAWSRATDADADVEVTSGMFTFVEEGSTQAGEGWVLVTANPITVGTTDLAFTQFSGVSGPPTGTAGGDLTGTYPNPTLAVDYATQAELDAHTSDPTAAHAASAISFTPDGSIAATTVQLAIQEVRDEAGSGSSVSDATISTTDITTNNASITKHGWMPKADNNRSHYYDGKGAQSPLHSVKEWFVDATVSSGGDGHSPAGAFTTFAAAMAAVQSRDIVYILSDLSEDLVINTYNIAVIGVGKQRIIYGTGSSAITAKTIHVKQARCKLENLLIWGHTNFKGIHLCFDRADEPFTNNIEIDGTGGSFGAATFHSISPMAGTGIGGTGIAFHHVDTGTHKNTRILNCSIGIGNGTWSTRQGWDWLRTSQNKQTLVVGLYTGSSGSFMSSPASWQYGGASQEQTGSHQFKNWTDTSSYSSDQTAPQIDLIGGGGDSFGSGEENYALELGGNNTFEHCDWTEGTDYNFVRIGTRGNTFINCSNSNNTFWAVMGQLNHFINCFFQENFWLYSDGNVVENAKFRTAASSINGHGNLNIIRNTNIQNCSMTGAGNIYDHCTFISTGAAQTQTSLGPLATVGRLRGRKALTYGTTIATDMSSQAFATIAVTNSTAFTMSNPTDSANYTDTSKIMVTDPVTWDFAIGAGVTHGAISVGNKFLLAGGGTTLWSGGTIAASKRRQFTFYYDFGADKFVELSRSPADIG